MPKANLKTASVSVIHAKNLQPVSLERVVLESTRPKVEFPGKFKGHEPTTVSEVWHAVWSRPGIDYLEAQHVNILTAVGPNAQMVWVLRAYIPATRVEGLVHVWVNASLRRALEESQPNPDDAVCIVYVRDVATKRQATPMRDFAVSVIPDERSSA